MYSKKCKCEQSSKNFKYDIGPFFTNSCCKIAAAPDPIPELTADLDLGSEFRANEPTLFDKPKDKPKKKPGKK